MGELVFVWLHVPLFLAIFFFVGNDPNSDVGQVVSGFAIVHVVLHWFYRNHPDNEFTTWGAWSLILAAGLFGGLHLLAANI